MAGVSGPTSFFSAGNQKQLESSFNEFISRPENRGAVADVQRQEFKQALSAQDRARQLDFQEKLQASSLEVQQNLAPLLRHKVLRRVLHTLCNDPGQGLQAWATNPRVLAMLGQAQALLEDGRLTEKELEHVLLQHLKAPETAGSAEFLQQARPRITLTADMLMSALNEHLTERRQGSAAYRERRFEEAREHYDRALSIVELVQGSNESDQAEVQRNRLAVLLNLAAVDMAQQRFGAAATRCSQVLEAESGHAQALLRRARAHAERRLFKEAEADLCRAEEAQPTPCSEEEAHQLRGRMQALRVADVQADRRFCSKMFG